MSQPLKQAEVFLRKAAADESVLDLILPHKNISDDIFGFHCQQAVEKMLKALLSVNGIRFRKTHDLKELMDILADGGHPLPTEFQGIDSLSPYGALLRYEEVAPQPRTLDRGKLRQMIKLLREWVTPLIH